MQFYPSKWAVFAALNLAAPSPALAASLSVAPVSLEIQSPGSTSTITLGNTGADTINAQIRVFKWTQMNGTDSLLPTKDVVASPPALKLNAGQTNVVRIVRLAKEPAAQEEAYRLVVDELPKGPKQSTVGVGISLRYSIPVFFVTSNAAPALTWSVQVSGQQLRVMASNSGGRRVRIADLRIGAGGRTLSVGPGLAGYVLANSRRVWIVRNTAKFNNGASFTVTAEGDNGHIEANAGAAQAQ